MFRVLFVLAVCTVAFSASRLGQASVTSDERRAIYNAVGEQIGVSGDISEAAKKGKKKKKKKKKKGGSISSNFLLGGDLKLKENACLDKDPAETFTVAINYRTIDGSVTVDSQGTTFDSVTGDPSSFTAQTVSNGATIVIEATKSGARYKTNYTVTFPTGGASGACSYVFKGNLPKFDL